MMIDKVQPDWSRRGSRLCPGVQPLTLLQLRYGSDPTTPASLGLARWLDHCYMGIDSETGQRVWVAEPYGIPPEAKSDFQMLREAGFTVEVDPAGLAKSHSDRVSVVLIRKA